MSSLINILLDKLQEYSITFTEFSIPENIVGIKPSHIGFDIVDNTLRGIKLYFKVNGEKTLNRYGISADNYEESLSFSEVLTGTEKRFRWICCPAFERFPYSQHKKTTLRLLSETSCVHLNDELLSIADTIQSKTGSQRFPLVGFGAVQEDRHCLKTLGAKFYYTFWQAQKWDSPYASNDSKVSLAALNALKSKMYNPIFYNHVIGITETALMFNNLISMYAVNISMDEIAEKIYFVTDEEMWLNSLSSMHKAIFNVTLDSKLSKLFQELSMQGFRYEEIAYSVKNGKSNLMVYFMI